MFARVVSRARAVVFALAALAIVVLGGACNVILGLGDYRDLCKPEGLGDPPDCVYADAGVATGTGGHGGSTPTPCDPGTTETCFEGPGGPTADVKGLCQKGKHTCEPTGDAYGECKGQVLPAVESCASKEDENCDGLDCIEWNDHWKSSNQGGALPTCLVRDPVTHDILVAGLASGATSFPGKTLVGIGKGDGFVARLDKSGTFVDAKLFGDTGFDNFQSCALDKDRNLVIGGVTDTGFTLDATSVPPGIFVLKLSRELKLIWIKSLGGTNGVTAVGPTTTSTDPHGDILISGWFTGQLTLDDGSSTATAVIDPYLLKMSGVDGATSVDSSGDVWFQTIPGDDQIDSYLSGGVDSSGSIVFAGTITKPSTLFGKALSPNGASDIVFGKVSTRGVPIWLRQVGDAESQTATSIAVDSEGALLVKGSFIGTLELPGGPKLTASEKTPFVFRWQTTDDASWARAFEPGSILTVAVENSNAVVSARFKGSFDFGDGAMTGGAGQNVALAKLDADGSVLWSRLFKSEDAGAIFTVMRSEDTGEVLVAGLLPGSIDFGAGKLVGHPALEGVGDLLVAKFGK